MKQSFIFYYKVHTIVFVPMFLVAMEENSIVQTTQTENGNPFVLLHQTFTDLKKYKPSKSLTIDADIQKLDAIEKLFANEAMLLCLQPEQINEYKKAFPILFQLFKKIIPYITYIAPELHEIYIALDAQESFFNKIVNDSSCKMFLCYKSYKDLVFHTFATIDMHIKEQMYLCNELADMYSQDSIFICFSAKKRAFLSTSRYDSIMATKSFLNNMYIETLTKLFILQESLLNNNIRKHIALKRFLGPIKEESSPYNLNIYRFINAIERIIKDLLNTKKSYHEKNDSSQTIELFNKLYLELYFLNYNIFVFTENPGIKFTEWRLANTVVLLDWPIIVWLRMNKKITFLNLQSKIQNIIRLNYEDIQDTIDYLWQREIT